MSMQIKIIGQIPEGLATKIKEVTSEFNLVVDEEVVTPEGLDFEFSKVGSTPTIHMSGKNACTDSCEG